MQKNNDIIVNFNKINLLLQTKKQDNLLYDSAGKSLEASLVFEHGIRHLKNCAYRVLEAMYVEIKNEDIEYVFTVPEIGGEEVKLLIREAAIKVIYETICKQFIVYNHDYKQIHVHVIKILSDLLRMIK